MRVGCLATALVALVATVDLAVRVDGFAATLVAGLAVRVAGFGVATLVAGLAVRVAGLATGDFFAAGFAVEVTAFRVLRAAGAVRFAVVVAVFTVFVLAVVVAIAFAVRCAEVLAVVFVGVGRAAEASAPERGRNVVGTAPPGCPGGLRPPVVRCCRLLGDERPVTRLRTSMRSRSASFASISPDVGGIASGLERVPPEFLRPRKRPPA
jgi:hypothetical protein